MTLSHFLRILSATLPVDGSPFDLMPFKSNINLLAFVHRIEGLESGLYCLLREPEYLLELKDDLDPEFLWHHSDNELPLYLLKTGDFRTVAADISCNQDIAADSCFSLAMLSRCELIISLAPWRYPTLYWEAGLIG